MATRGTWSTSTSLIDRVKKNDPQAWERFTSIYTPLVYTWGRRQGLSQHDAGDLVQDVFTRVFQYIQTFDPESFRGWLWTVTRNQIHKMTGKNPSDLLAPGGSHAYEKLNQLPADGESSIVSLLETDQAPWDRPENKALVVSRVLDTIRSDFTETTWKAFWRTTVENSNSREVAEELGMTSVAVRHAKFRVLSRLKEELERF